MEMYHMVYMVYMGLYHDTGCIAYGVWGISDTLETLRWSKCGWTHSQINYSIVNLVSLFGTFDPCDGSLQE
jgi:hypothetical protein